MSGKMLAYLQLTKPRISLLFAITGLTAILMEGSLLSHPLRIAALVLAIFMVGGSANAFNQYFEREIDKQMKRTAKKRPLPRGIITPRSALVFSISVGVIGTLSLFILGGGLAAIFGLATILYYSFYYTLWLKPRTPYNIVIGGAAGAMGPLIGWAAASGGVDWIPFILFLIVFMWTPPHFWALALCCKEDYEKVSLPMLPVVAGEEVTRRYIILYSLLLVPLTLSLYFFKGVGELYLGVAFILGALFIAGSFWIHRKKTIQSYWAFFGFSIAYLLLLFIALIFDTLL
ncbi:MAG: protoheme IX farnesyltransferase [Deltaproteobacteria bacterium]|nr:protoheme IX farnesyltransferase [Deltaproteobacteria bacterium]